MEALEKMPGHPRLYRRGATYYHRAAVPKDIADSYPKREETFSLKTKDHAEAIRRVRVAAVEVDRRFAEHRQWLVAQSAPFVEELTEDQLNTIKQAYLHHLTDEDEEVRLDGFEEPAEIKQFDPRYTFDGYNALIEDTQDVTRNNFARGRQDLFFRDEAEEVLSWEGIEVRLAPDSRDWSKVVRTLQEATLVAAESKKKRSLGEVVQTPPAPLHTPTSASAGAVPEMSEAFDRWFDQKSLSNRWAPKSANDYRSWISLFMDVCGDRPITEYSKTDGRSFKDLLMKLPSNWRKMPETRDGNVRSAVEQGAKHGLQTISIATVNKAIGRINAFWEWASREYDGVAGDVVRGLKLDDTTSARNKRLPFSPEQLQQLFNSPIYTGCQSETRRSVRGVTDMRHSHWHWLPLLGLLTGARLNDLCQLFVDDIRIEDNIPFFYLTNEGEGQRIKGKGNDVRFRKVPVHDELIRLGSTKFVEDQKTDDHPRLFKSLTPDVNGYFSEKVSEAFSRYLTQITKSSAAGYRSRG